MKGMVAGFSQRVTYRTKQPFSLVSLLSIGIPKYKFLWMSVYSPMYFRIGWGIKEAVVNRLEQISQLEGFS